MNRQTNKVLIGGTLSILLCPAPDGKMFGALVDTEDVDRVLAAGFWRVEKKKKRTFYVIRHARPKIFLHTFITGIIGIDHRNRRGTDNRKSNLRPATNSQNAANKPPYDGRRFKGVSYRKGRSTYRAYIKHIGKMIYLGSFTNPYRAARAYDKKALELFGDFAYLNFPQASTQ